MSRNSYRIGSLEKLCIAVCEDLKLFASLYLAHFIVSRTLRTRRKERAARLRNFKLINESKQTSSMSVHMNKNGTLRQALLDHSFGHRRVPGK
jgi:hypothetical protein